MRRSPKKSSFNRMISDIYDTFHKLRLYTQDLGRYADRFFKTIKPTTIAFLHDVFMMAAASLISLALLRGEDLTLISPFIVLRYLLVYTLVSAAVFIWVGPYKHVWKYASFNDVMRIVLSVIYINLIFMPLQIRVLALPQYSLSITVVTSVMSFALITLPRLFYLLAAKQPWRRWFQARERSRALRTLIIGAGDQAEIFIRQAQAHNRIIHDIVGIIDDNRNKIGQYIHGIEVLGRFHDLVRILSQHQRRHKPIDVLMITDINLYGPAVRPLQDIMTNFDVEVVRFADFNEMIISLKNRSQRSHGFADLFQNKPLEIPYERDESRKRISGKRVAILGANSSFAETLVKEIAELGPVHLSIHGEDEKILSQLEQFFTQHHPYLSHQYYLGGLDTKTACKQFFEHEQPHILILCPLIVSATVAEIAPAASLNRALAPVINLLSAIDERHVKNVVLISTTFVNDRNSTYGKIMRLTEEYVTQELTDFVHGKTIHFCTVRLPNLLDSSDNILMKAQRYIDDGCNVVLPHPDMYRYFMTDDEATSFTLSTLSFAATQKMLTFVPNFTKPESVLNLVYGMIHRMNTPKDKDIGVEFSHQSFGEPIQEILLDATDEILTSATQHLVTIQPKRLSRDKLSKVITASLRACKSDDDFEVQKALGQIIP